MGTWQFAAWLGGATAAIGGTRQALTAAQFSPVINLGAVILGILLSLMTLLGIFYAAKRREDVSGLKVALEAAQGAAAAWKEERDAELASGQRARDDQATEREEQREIRHGLKNEIAGLRAELEVERRKHDLTTVVEGLAASQTAILSAMSESNASAVEAITTVIRASNDWQRDIFERIDAGQAALVKALENLAELRPLGAAVGDTLQADEPPTT